MANSKTIGTSKVGNNIGSAGVGFVVIPDGIDDYERYIEDCYRTNTLTIWGGRGYGYFSNIHVDQDVMQNIQFPEDPENNNRGTAVVWIKDENSQLPIIIASLRKQDDFYMLGVNQFRLARKKGNKNVELFIDGNESELTVNLNGDSESPAELKIKAVSENNDSKISISSDSEVNVSAEKINIASSKIVDLRIKKDGQTKGQVKYVLGEGMSILTEENVSLTVRDSEDEEKMVAKYEKDNGFSYTDEYKHKVECKDSEVSLDVADGKANFKYKAGDGFKYTDEFNNEIVCKNGEIDVTGQKIVETGNVQHNNGSEPMVKGQTLMNLLNELLSACMALTVTTPVGPSTPPVNVAQFASIQAKLNTILSQQSKLD